MSKFMLQDDIDTMINQYSNSKIRVVIQKNCGYCFMVLLHDNSQLTDLYREVELVYSHMSCPLNLYYGENYIRNNENVVNTSEEKNDNNDKKKDRPDTTQCSKCCQKKLYEGGNKKFIPRSSMKFKDYVNQVNLGPCTEVPEKVCYRLYLDICDKH